MFMLKVAAGVVTLNEIVPPLLTLMSVANPWMVESPEPETSHSDEGLPGSWFSAGIGLLLCAVNGPSTKVPVTKRATPAITRIGSAPRTRERNTPSMRCS